MPWWKRATDLVLVWAALIVLGPLMLLVALSIKLSSRGPVFYVAPRMGWRGVPFGQLKFRTMHVGADRQGAFTAQHDRRVFAVGRWLRLFKIDELPQVLNILHGEMSVVGPRPEEVATVEKCYTPAQREVLNAVPGLTGLPQVRYFPDGDRQGAHRRVRQAERQLHRQDLPGVRSRARRQRGVGDARYDAGEALLQRLHAEVHRQRQHDGGEGCPEGREDD